jgi:carbamoyl-phosphate synthase small subunit
MKAVLALADGKVYEGEAFGAPGEVEGEIVFNTSMSGYQEVITDPSYCGQMVVMTYPLIGNYGINPEDFESERPYLCGFIVREVSGIPSNWRSTGTLSDFLKQYGVVGIQGVDTRALTRHIREKGAQQAVLSTITTDHKTLIEKAKNSQGLVGRDMVKEVTCREPYEWTEGEQPLTRLEQGPSTGPVPRGEEKPFFVVAYDFGVKRNILRKLIHSGCSVRVVPASTPWQEVLDMQPDGVFLSNGPGDPAAVPYAIENIQNLLGKTPVFGICLGHQILTLALGAETYKLRFGHHGGNQPVMDLKSGKVEITAQNHGFAVKENSIGKEAEVSSLNLNDKTIEGIRHKTLPVFSVQYHPEASPGPHDSDHLFDEFFQLMKKNR